MFDIGGLELLVVAVILIVVVGPKELPAMLRVFGRTMAKVRGMAAEFRGQFDDALREAELDDVRKTVSDVSKLNPKTAMREAMKPFADAQSDLKRDLDANATVDLDDTPDLDGAPGFDAPVDLDTGPEMEGPAPGASTDATSATAAPKVAEPKVTTQKPAAPKAAASKPTPKAKPSTGTQTGAGETGAVKAPATP